MQDKKFKYPDTAATKYVIDELAKKGVTPRDIADIAYSAEIDYIDNLTHEETLTATYDVLHKREVCNNAMVGLNLDKLATKKLLDEPLQTIVAKDAGVFGVDEVLAMAMSNIYGSISVTNFGYFDKAKTGIIRKLDTSEKVCNTFIDDIVGAIASAVAAKVTHDHS